MAHPSTPIEDHGLIGDLRTAALVAKSGEIDFLCVPDFDSPSVFASLLDPDAGGFSVAPGHDGLRTTQLYLPETNVLLTRFMSDDGIAELSDLMPLSHMPGPQRIVRRIMVIRGGFDLVMRCAPRFDYARAGHETRLDGRNGVFQPIGDGPALVLRASVDLRADAGVLSASFHLDAGQHACFVLEIAPDDIDLVRPLDGDDDISAVFKAVVNWWHDWIGRATYVGRWREVVARSALALKLLTSARHGAIVAAVTFGLPEQPGGERNWDYRYCWIRDASFTMYAFVRLGLIGEAEAFVGWIGERVIECAKESDPLRVMYRLNGASGDEALAEITLEHMRGWRDSRPVRIGNGAATQVQLDIYGEVLDAIYLANKYGRASTYDEWNDVVRIVEWVRGNWRRPDRGIWEGRGEDKHFLHSRLMCWVAVDRAIRLAVKRSLPAPLPEWNAARAEIHASIHAEFWDEARGCFVQYPGAATPDGSMLLMPLVRFISPIDPRWLGTLRSIETVLVQDALVYRRAEDDRALDGLAGGEGSFLACSFWYVECLARAGDVAQARLLFEKLLGYANHLGLYAEELSPSGRQLGNFPQALTHLALISAASFLDRALSGKRAEPWS